MGAKISKERIGKLFAKLDKNGDGFLSIDELAPLAQACEFDLKEFRATFEKADKSKDGVLNLEEASKLLKNMKITEEQFEAVENGLSTVLGVLTDVTVVTMKGNQGADRKILCRGDLNILQINDGLVALTVSDKFVYALKQKLPTVRIAKQFYCLPGVESGTYYGLLMSKCDDEALDSFDVILDKETTFKGFFSVAPAKKSAVPEGEAKKSGGAVATSSFFSRLKDKAAKAVKDVQANETYKKLSVKATKAYEDAVNSDTYKKAKAAAEEQLAKLKDSDSYQNAKKKAQEKLDEIRKSEAFKEAQKLGKQGIDLAKEKLEEGKAYTQEIIKSQKGKSVGDKISTGVNVATDGAVVAIGYTAKFAGETVKKTAQILRKTLKPVKKKPQVSEKTKAYVKTAAKWSGKAVVVSKHVASTALAVADALSSKLTEAIESSSVYKDNQHKMQSQAVQDTKKVVKAGLEGSFKIIDAMIDAGLLFVAEVTVAAADVAEHTHGSEVGAVAKDAGAIVTNAAKAGANLRYVGLTPMAKRALLGTTVEMLGTEEEKKAIKAGKNTNATATLAVNLVAAQASVS